MTETDDVCVADPIEVERVGWSSVDRAEWDEFGRTCGGSIRATHGYATSWQLRHPFTRRLRAYKVRLAGGGPVIGQCVIGLSGHRDRLFLDRLQLRDEQVHLWGSAMAAILADLGPGNYTYGWVLNVEPSREAELASIPAVKIENVRPITIQGVEFGRWITWEQYWKAISENSKRNAKAAVKGIPDMKVTTLRGVRALRAVPLLARLRARLSDRKNLSLPIARLIGSYSISLIYSARYMWVTYVTGGGKPLYCYYGGEYGQATYYLEGASVPDNRGAAWHVLLGELQRAYERTPQGLFIMGFIDPATHDDANGGGLLRSREACRVTNFPTAIVDFVYGARI